MALVTPIIWNIFYNETKLVIPDHYHHPHNRHTDLVQNESVSQNDA